MRAAVVFLSLAACHLADDPEITCAEGQHVEVGRCKNDDPVGEAITISSCNTVSPATLTTKANAAFRFKNDDKVDHVIRGVDGQVWATAKAFSYSEYVGLAKVGSWQFDVDSCSKVGVVIVE